VFNVADMAIDIGVACLALDLLSAEPDAPKKA
jgi:lipoprotein signal peptidase